MAERKHTAGATEAARIILGGRRILPTVFGRKTQEGLADIIDRKTGALDLLAACEAIVSVVWASEQNQWPDDLAAAADKARAAIAKATP